MSRSDFSPPTPTPRKGEGIPNNGESMTFERSEAQMKAQAEMERRRAERQDAGRELCEWLGLPLICYEPGCRRAGRCAGLPSPQTYGLQPCLMHYREEMRFLLIGPDNLAEQMRAESHLDDGPSEPADGMTLIELIYGSDRETLDRLRRPKGVRGPGSWEYDPDGFARYMDEGDWRNPAGVARRPPASFYGRVVD
jgi:hypothetical protein